MKICKTSQPQCTHPWKFFGQHCCLTISSIDHVEGRPPPLDRTICYSYPSYASSPKKNHGQPWKIWNPCVTSIFSWTCLYIGPCSCSCSCPSFTPHHMEILMCSKTRNVSSTQDLALIWAVLKSATGIRKRCNWNWHISSTLIFIMKLAFTYKCLHETTCWCRGFRSPYHQEWSKIFKFIVIHPNERKGKSDIHSMYVCMYVYVYIEVYMCMCNYLSIYLYIFRLSWVYGHEWRIDDQRMWLHQYLRGTLDGGLRSKNIGHQFEAIRGKLNPWIRPSLKPHFPKWFSKTWTLGLFLGLEDQCTDKNISVGVTLLWKWSIYQWPVKIPCN